METGKKLKSKLQSSPGMTAEVEVCNLIGGTKEEVLLRSLPQQHHSGSYSSPSTHILTRFLSPGMVTSWWGGLIFLRLLVGVGLPRGGQRGQVDHTSEREGRRQGGKETSKPGLNNIGSRPRDSIF